MPRIAIYGANLNTCALLPDTSKLALFFNEFSNKDSEPYSQAVVSEVATEKSPSLITVLLSDQLQKMRRNYLNRLIKKYRENKTIPSSRAFRGYICLRTGNR